jgi:hypothetical protein
MHRAQDVDLTPEDLERARALLVGSRERLAAAVEGLSGEALAFRPAPGRWTIAENVEHLAIVERLVVERVLPRLAAAPPPPADRDPCALDAMLRDAVPRPGELTAAGTRAPLFEAPPPIRPAGAAGAADSLAQFAADRDAAIAFLDRSAPELRRHAIDHLKFGPLDGYQWMLFVGAHTDRHVRQIASVKSDGAFPRARVHDTVTQP